MLIELQGVSFQVIADIRREGIFVQNSKTHPVRVYAHPKTPHHELIAFLEAYLRKPARAKTEVIAEYGAEITIFGRMCTVVIDPKISTAYIRGQTVYLAKMSPASVPKIKRELLFQFVKQQVGEWEDRLQVLVEKIQIRKMSKSPFVVRNADNAIVYSENLTEQPQNIIAYVVAISVCQFANLTPMLIENLLQLHLPDWKNSKRTIAFEYGI